MRCVLLATALVLCAPAAIAQTESVSLDWVRMPGAESCAPSRVLIEGVEKRLGRRVFTVATNSELAIEGRVERAKNVWRATLTSYADGKSIGTRVVESSEASCRALDDSIVLVLAVTIDPDGGGVEAPPPPPPEPPPAPKPKYVTVVKHVRHTVQVQPERVWSGDVRLSASAAAGVLPGVAWGARLSGVLSHRAFVPVELDARVLAASSDDGERSTAFQNLAAGLAICPAVGARIRVEACGAITLSILRAKGAGFDVDYDRTLVLPGVSLRGRVSATIAGPLFAWSGAEMLVGVVRGVFVAERPGRESVTVYRQPRAGLVLDLGLGLRFD